MDLWDLNECDNIEHYNLNLHYHLLDVSNLWDPIDPRDLAMLSFMLFYIANSLAIQLSLCKMLFNHCFPMVSSYKPLIDGVSNEILMNDALQILSIKTKA